MKEYLEKLAERQNLTAEEMREQPKRYLVKKSQIVKLQHL